MRRIHPSLAFVPELYDVEVKMPKPLIPIDWKKDMVQVMLDMIMFQFMIKMVIMLKQKKKSM